MAYSQNESINLLQNSYFPEELSKEQHVDVGPTDFLVPAERTHYLCKYIKMVDANETIYVTGVSVRDMMKY